MPFPGVKVKIGNNNLLANVSVPDAVPAIVAIGALTGVHKLYGPEDYPSDSTAGNQAFVEEFYNEVGGRTPLLYMEYGGTTSTDLPAAVKKMCELHPEVNLIAAIEGPVTHTFTKNGALCDNVVNHVTALKPILEARQAAGHPVRVFLPGHLDPGKVESGISYVPKNASNGYVAIVLGSAYDNGRPSVGVALGRATKVAAHVKLGDGTYGPLAISEVYYGGEDTPYDVVGVSRVEEWHDAGFLTFMRRQGQEGWYFGVDNMCSSDDYSILAHGRVVDKAQRVAIAAYMPYVETSMQIADDGTIDVADAESMAKIIESQLRAQMGNQVSNVKVVVPVEQDLINTRTLTVNISVLPLGYNTWINVSLNLVSNLKEEE